MKVNFELKGMKEVNTALSDLAKKSVIEAKKEIKNIALNTEKLSKENLITNKSVVTGTLLRSMTTDILRDGMEAEDGTVTEYAPYVEFGHIGKRISGGEQVGGFLVRAKPYLVPAFDTAIQGVEERIRRKLE